MLAERPEGQSWAAAERPDHVRFEPIETASSEPEHAGPEERLIVPEIKERKSFRWIPAITLAKAIKRLSLTVASAFGRAARGELGLAWTFWGWGFLYGLPVGLFHIATSLLAIKFSGTEWLATSLSLLGYLVVWPWTVFLAIAIINAARHTGKRSVWGWLATGVAGLSLATLPVQMYQAFNPKLENWQQVEGTVSALNIAAPIKFSDSLMMTEVLLDKQAKLITFQLEIALETINQQTFDPVALKNTELDACPDLKIYFDSPVEVLRFVYNAKDGTQGQIEITDSDCGFAPPREPAGPTAKA